MRTSIVLCVLAATLSVQAQVVVEVCGAEKNTDTRLSVHRGESWTFEVIGSSPTCKDGQHGDPRLVECDRPDCARWADGRKLPPSTAEGWELWYLRPFFFTKRVRSAHWYTGHLGAMPDLIVGAPFGPRSQAEPRIRKWFEQRVSGIEAAIQQTDGRRILVQVDAAQELVRPFPRLRPSKLHEEVARLLGAPELRNRVDDFDRCRDLLRRPAGEVHPALGKIQVGWRQFHAGRDDVAFELRDDIRLVPDPDLPANDRSQLRKLRVAVRPEVAKRCEPDRGKRRDEALVRRPPSRGIDIGILSNLVLERRELSLRHVHRREELVPAGVGRHQLDFLAAIFERLQGIRETGFQLELHMQPRLGAYDACQRNVRRALNRFCLQSRQIAQEALSVCLTVALRKWFLFRAAAPALKPFMVGRGGEDNMGQSLKRQSGPRTVL